LENYHLKISFGDTVIPMTTAVLRELTIVQSINTFLPEFRLRISDNTGTFTHVAPFDKNMSNVSIELAPDDTSLDINSFNFTVYRRKPGADQSTPATIYDIQGLLTSNNLFGPDYSRSFSGNIKTNLEGIGTNELLTNNNGVSISLDYDKTLLQPLWSNIQFFKYLKENLTADDILVTVGIPPVYRVGEKFLKR